jgi:hypothetical protein
MTDTTIDFCAYCLCEVSSLDVPDVDDDDAWAEIAREHDDTCEWVLTRAHRIDPPAEERTDRCVS